MPNFNGKVVLVTGSASGIGRATAIYFAKSGAKLAITDKNSDGLEKTKHFCITEIGLTENDVICIPADLADNDQVKQIPVKAVEKFKKLDVLVNCAGISHPQASIDGDIEIFDLILQVNLRSIIVLSKACIPYLTETKGCIVNVSSMASVLEHPLTYYGVCKAGLDKLTKCLALELAPKKIRVNCVNPTAIDTPIYESCFGMTREQTTKVLDDVAKTHPLEQGCIPALECIPGTEDLAKAIGFLASDDASMTTGHLLHVDAGAALTSCIDGRTNPVMAD